MADTTPTPRDRTAQFLIELADLVDRYAAEFYYTIDDDGIHVALGGNGDCFVGFGPRPGDLRTAAGKVGEVGKPA